MTKEFNINLFSKAIVGLNNNLEKVGGVFHKNIDFLASNEPLTIKKEGVNKMAIEIKENMDNFNNSYLDFENLYNEVNETIQENNENKKEYLDFMNHVEEAFPKYISELNQSMCSMGSLDITTEEFTSVMNNLNKVLISIIEVFKKFLKLSNNYLNKN
ncbi:MAG: hypothetical protein KO202_02810 [Methanobacteriaceae archaeon]|jgi:hypothetical protein|nr:hypothetical protein [Methanobacteriaceae archaeon]